MNVNGAGEVHARQALDDERSAEVECVVRAVRLVLPRGVEEIYADGVRVDAAVVEEPGAGAHEDVTTEARIAAADVDRRLDLHRPELHDRTCDDVSESADWPGRDRNGHAADG